MIEPDKCHDCARPAALGRVRCPECLKKVRERGRKVRGRSKPQGPSRCASDCGAMAVPGQRCCAKCISKARWLAMSRRAAPQGVE
jgi:hypothetical protein